jgi:hypothetical protein
MNERQNDESLTIDALFNELSQDVSGEFQERLKQDGSLRQLHSDVTHTLNALKLLPEVQAPDDLVAKTLGRIRQVRETDALIARQEIGRSRDRGLAGVFHNKRCRTLISGLQSVTGINKDVRGIARDHKRCGRS